MPRCLLLFLSLGLCLVMGNAIATPIALNVLSGTDWRSSDQFQTGWSELGFNDSDWSFARAPYPGPTDPTTLIAGTEAEHMWHDPDNTSDGGTGPIQAFFRYEFDMALNGDHLPLFAQALISVDDDYEFFVNGNLAYRNADGGFADQVDLVDFASQLVSGRNVLAIHAVDGGWGNPWNRGYERVLFDGVVRSAALPVPAVLPLLGVGLLGLAWFRRRWS